MKEGKDALNLMIAAWSNNAALLAIPVARLGEQFFRLKSGDVSPFTAARVAFRDFVYEANKGSPVWLVSGAHQLAAKLANSSA